MPAIDPDPPCDAVGPTGAGGAAAAQAETRSMAAAVPIHFKRPTERPFSAAERGRVTLLIGGLTVRHDRLMAAAIEALGYKTQLIAVPTKADYQAGREYGNNGQCNPTHFTVGALVNHLVRLRDEQALPVDQIMADYVFVTAGSCGPCRFGMYEAEFRLALRNAGFEGFRVLVFGQNAESSQRRSAADAGLALTPEFFAALVDALMLGDLLNAVAHHLRPYELEAGATDRVLAQCLAICEQALRCGETAGGGIVLHELGRLLGFGNPASLARLVARYQGQRVHVALERCRELIDAGIAVDYTRARPVVKVTGEFWAQTTEGDGNFRMFRFLESEGAEVLVEPVATWLDYSLHWARQTLVDRRGLGSRAASGAPQRWRRALRERRDLVLLALGRMLFRRAFDSRRRALGGTVHALANQFDLQRLGHPYYNSRCGGGEGHLEVAKNIYYSHRNLAHMVLSLKPFGCMPSTQSDGAQAAVQAHYPDMTFLPVETSGEGDINAYSRVQMVLGETHAKCRQEFDRALALSGRSLEDMRAYVAAHPQLQRPLQHIARTPGFTGRAAHFALHVARRMDRDRAWPDRRCAAEAGAA